MLAVRNDDLEALKPLLDTGTFAVPQIKMSIYKNRRGRYKGIYLWCKADLSTCRIEPIFATNYNYELIKIDNIKVTVKDETKLDFSTEALDAEAIIAAMF